MVGGVSSLVVKGKPRLLDGELSSLREASKL